VSAIKDLQRSDVNAKQQWWAYCDAAGEGIHDPAKHAPQFLQSFIENYSAGKRFEPAVPVARAGGGGGNGGVGSGGSLAQLCKEGQRKSQHWKQAWAQYCLHYGGGRNDPDRHDVTFITGFLDYIAGRGVMALSAMAPANAVWGPPAKRPRTTAPTPTAATPTYSPVGVAGMAGPAAGAMGQGKEGLVHRVKTFQRSGDEAKQQWGAYCDEHLGGVRDPNRHDMATLKQFVDAYGIP